MRGNRNGNIHRLSGTVILAVALLTAGCGSQGGSQSTAEPNFCPTKYAGTLPAVLNTANIEPRAYYQMLSTEENTSLVVVLYACDPDDPTTTSGLSWRADLGPCEGPCNGSLSQDSGIYPDGIITYTPNAGFTGTDSFFYTVDDGITEGNIAEITIAVTPGSPVSGSLYFGGWDDSGTYQLWSYDSADALSPVPGGASVIGGAYGDLHDSDVLGNRLFFITDTGDGGGALYSYNLSGGFMTHFQLPFYLSNMAIIGGAAYIGENSSSGYLWAADESGTMNTIPGTSGRYPQDLAGYGGILYFSGDNVGYYQLWTLNGSGVLETHSSSMMGLNPADFTPFDNDIFFVGDTDMGQRTLWRFNGASPIGTVGDLDIPWISGDSALAVLDSLLCINARANTASGQLWSYHPDRGFNALTANTAYDVNPSHMTLYSGLLLFNGRDDTNQSRLMYTDGTIIGTVPGTTGLEPRNMAVFDGRLFFAGGVYPDSQLWYISSPLSAPVRASSVSSANGEGGLNPSGLIVF
jgi:hypothetical protein